MAKEVVIIGGNTAGSLASLHLAKHMPVSVIESKASFQKTCSGILTKSVYDQFPVPGKVILNRLDTVRVHYPNQQYSTIRFKTPDIVIDRKRFNEHLHGLLQKKGVKLLKEHTFRGMSKKGVLCTAHGTGKEKLLPATHVIGADGALSRVAKTTGLYRNRGFFTGMKAVIKKPNDNAVELYPFFQDLGWLSPIDETTMELGIATRSDPLQTWKAFCDMLGITPPRPEAALIPHYDPKTQTETIFQGKQVLLVGDAATHVKATTAGGIIQGMIGAKAAAQAILHNTSYERRWKRVLGKELWLHHLLRKAVDRFNEKDWRRVQRILDNRHIRKIAAEQSRDSSSRMARDAIIHAPQVLAFAPKVIA